MLVSLKQPDKLQNKQTKKKQPTEEIRLFPRTAIRVQNYLKED